MGLTDASPIAAEVLERRSAPQYRQWRTSMRSPAGQRWRATVVEIDANTADRSLRTVVSVRKNWLYSGPPDGVDRSAAIYSCLALSRSMDCESGTPSAVRPGMVADHTIHKIDELLPWNIRTQVPSLRIAA